jgi:BlaI family transcriptional regulator, penicillinase repressor
MARTPQDVTDAELAVLQVLWETGPATIRQLRDRLYPGEGTSKYGTVQKLLERLMQGDYVTRQESAGAHVFTAVVDRDELIGRRLRSVAEKLCGGSVTPLLTHLMRTQRLSAAEREELRALIDELDKPRGKRR